MAVPIGPWISPTLVLIGIFIFRLIGNPKGSSDTIAYATVAGSIGGILATACGFSFPTLYFLDPELFNSWLQHPAYFVAVMVALSSAAGWFGMWIANVIEQRLIVQDELAFPIGQLIYKMIAIQQQVQKAWELVIGFIGTLIFCLMQGFMRIMPRFITIIPAINKGLLRIPLVRIDFSILPMLVAIGFIAGHMITIPLIVGSLSKVVITTPLNRLFFTQISSMEFLFAFCAGMVLAGALMGFIKTPQVLIKSVKKQFKKSQSGSNSFTKWQILELIGVTALCIGVLSSFGMPVLAQIYLLVFTYICTYQIAYIAGKIGLAQLGRFATFVMVPALFLFRVNIIHIVFISVFVEIAGGVAADALFGRKMAYLNSLNHRTLRWFQYFGLLISTISVGVFFWLLITHFQLGSDDLFAQKAYARRLLLDVKSFNYLVLLCGLLFGFLLKKLKINPMLVLGGLLMPMSISIGLIIGGIGTWLVEDPEEYQAFWSGVFASNSVWMFIRALLLA